MRHVLQELEDEINEKADLLKKLQCEITEQTLRIEGNDELIRERQETIETLQYSINQQTLRIEDNDELIRVRQETIETLQYEISRLEKLMDGLPPQVQGYYFDPSELNYVPINE